MVEDINGIGIYSWYNKKNGVFLNREAFNFSLDDNMRHGSSAIEENTNFQIHRWADTGYHMDVCHFLAWMRASSREGKGLEE
jgi:hypothetical protein